MTLTDSSDQYKQVPPSEAPQLVPWTEESSFLSPGGAVAGVSAFAESATSTTSGRSRGFVIFTRIVVAIIVVSMAAASVWRMGGGF
jgi:hypothetical protein